MILNSIWKINIEWDFGNDPENDVIMICIIIWFNLSFGCDTVVASCCYNSLLHLIIFASISWLFLYRFYLIIYEVNDKKADKVWLVIMYREDDNVN